MNERARTLTGAAGFAALGSVAFVLGGAYTAGGANMFPQVIAGCMVVGATFLFLATLLRPSPVDAEDTLEGKFDTIGPRMLWIIVLSCLFVFAIPLLGMTTSSFLFILIGSWTLGLRRPVVVVGAAAAFALLMPWVFVHFLHILPPRDLVMSLFTPGRG